MNHKNRHSLLIAGIVMLLVALACGPSTTQPPPPQIAPTSTAAQQAGDITPTDTPVVPPTEATIAETPTPECTLDSGYVADVTIPDDTSFPPNTGFVKTWRVQNTGTCDWEEGTKLVYFSGDPLGGPTAVDVPPTAAGSNVDISVSFTSPGSPGTYRSNWQAQSPDGIKFGQQYYLQIVVPEPTPTPTNTPLPTDTPLPPTDTPPTDTPQPTAAPVAEWPLYDFGDQGPVVSALQHLLRAEGYSLTADGSFGPQTRSAVMSFQGAKGLVADGIVGPNTWKALVQGHTVTQGSSGEGVEAVQHLLKHKHGYSITVDGAFGPNTNTVVQDFQESHGLTVDGIVGRKTWKALVAD